MNSSGQSRRCDLKISLLRELPTLRGCTDKELIALARLVDMVEVEAGRVLTREGQPGRQAFVVVEGWADVTIRGEPVAAVGPGQFVGEMALLERQLRTATVTARTPMRLLAIGLRDFPVFADRPHVARAMAIELSRRLRRLEATPNSESVPRDRSE